MANLSGGLLVEDNFVPKHLYEEVSAEVQLCLQEIDGLRDVMANMVTREAYRKTLDQVSWLEALLAASSKEKAELARERAELAREKEVVGVLGIQEGLG